MKITVKWSSSGEKESRKLSSNTQTEDNKESELLVKSLLSPAPPDINQISRHTKRKIATITLCSDKVNAQNKLKQATKN